MRHILLSFFWLLVAPGVTHAQDLIASYTAFIGPADLVNSQGVRLTDFGQILRQDRANYHRFGLRDELDMPDPIFASLVYRERIPTIWTVMPGSEYVVDRVLAGQPQLLTVLVYGSFGEPAFILVGEGAG